jgi:hypothetical protein
VENENAQDQAFAAVLFYGRAFIKDFDVVAVEDIDIGLQPFTV